MKIIAINGSHTGKNGYTHYLINRLFKGASVNNAECEEITLSEVDINICKSCQACTTEKNYLKCIYDQKDDVSKIFEKMRTADILVFATPIYLMNMTGLLKIFLDRIYSTGDCSSFRLSKSGLFFHHITKEIFSKPFAVLICQDNYENETSKNVVSYFKTYSKFMDAPQAGTIVRKSGGLIGYGKNSLLEEKFPKIIVSHNAVEKAGSELALKGKISKKTEKTASQDIIPIPLFSILKNFVWFKKKAVERLNSQNI